MWFMIRKLQKTDIDRVADIWLDTNLKAHDFIPAKYWKNNFQLVKEYGSDFLDQKQLPELVSEACLRGFHKD